MANDMTFMIRVLHKTNKNAFIAEMWDKMIHTCLKVDVVRTSIQIC